MDVFFLTTQQMLMMFTLIVIGFILAKLKILPDNADKTMSRLETYLFAPALYFYNQLTKCTVDTFKENIRLMAVGVAILACAMVLAFFLSRLFVPGAKGNAQKEYLRNIYNYAMTFSNFGFLGNFLALGIFGQDGLFKYSLFTFFISIICPIWEKNDENRHSEKPFFEKFVQRRRPAESGNAELPCNGEQVASA